jgi:hypothetical protein
MSIYMSETRHRAYAPSSLSTTRQLRVTESSASSRLPSNGESMCVKCNEFDNKIAHYQRIAVHVTDQQTLEGIAGLIKQMTAEKAAIHCEPEKK